MAISESLKSTLKMKLEDIVPITSEEADRLHSMGWSSGFGWDSDLEIDWYQMNSDYNSVRWVEEDYGLYQEFCDDITKIRKDIANQEYEKSLKENSEIVDVLRAIKLLDANLDIVDVDIERSVDHIVIPKYKLKYMHYQN